MLALDVVIYTLLAWYLGQVLPSEFGVQQPPWFFILPSYWRPPSAEKTMMMTSVTSLGVDDAHASVEIPFMEQSGAGVEDCPTEQVDPAVSTFNVASTR